MRRIDELKKEIIHEILNSEEYREYRRLQSEIDRTPDLKRQVDEFRMRNFELQNSENVPDMFAAMENLNKEYADMRNQDIVNRYLMTEITFCSFMSNKSIRMLVSVSLNVLIIVLGIYLVFFMGSKAYSFGEKIFNEQAVDSDDNARTVEVTITTDIQAKKLAGMLYDKGLVHDKTIAYFQIQFSDYKDKFIGGTYELNTGMTPTEIMQVLAQSDSEEE